LNLSVLEIYVNRDFLKAAVCVCEWVCARAHASARTFT